MNNDELSSLVLRPINDWYDTIVEIPVQLIKPDQENLRTEFDEADLIDLGRNIEQVGQLDEITVFPILDQTGGWAGYFDLHDGERRWRASHLLGFSTLRAKIVPRPSQEELLFKKVSRVMQTRSLSPETKLAGLEKALADLGVMDKPGEWELFRDKLGGGPEWPQLVRVLRLQPKVREMFGDGSINFTIAQSVGRVDIDRQHQLAQFVIVNKINGRFLSTEMVPYLIENPEASPAEAFEHTRVGGWRQFSRSPYQKGEAPPTQEQVEKFLDACVIWERAWETVVVEGLVHSIQGDAQYIHRMKDVTRRIMERVSALAERLESDSNENSIPPELLSISPKEALSP